jgi:hypothetical protein
MTIIACCSINFLFNYAAQIQIVGDESRLIGTWQLPGAQRPNARVLALIGPFQPEESGGGWVYCYCCDGSFERRAVSVVWQGLLSYKLL